MKHSQLRAFHFVALHGGFSRAADAMGLTQPAVSDQVRKLEQEYDVLLFNRRNRQVTLTSQGEKLLEITRPLFETEARAFEFLSESRALATGSLRIIAGSAYHVTEVLSRFRQNFPGVRLAMSSGNSEDVLNALMAYKADIGVLGGTPDASDLEQVALGATPIIAFAAKNFKPPFSGAYSLQDLSAYPLVMREAGSKTQQKLDAAAKAQGVVLRPAIEAESREAVREIVASGAGIGFVSEAEYGQDARLVKIPIKGPAIPLEETVVCIKNRKDVRLIRAFMTQAAKLAPN